MRKDELLQRDETIIADLEKHLRYISGLIKRKGRAILSDYSITPPQFAVLQWLLDSGDMTIGELSNKMYLACSTMTDLIDRMEKKDLVKRVKDAKDRRVVRIQLLDKGKNIIDEVIKKRQGYLEEVLINFSIDEILMLREQLEKLYNEMARFCNKQER